MVAHLLVPAFDAEHPASVSPAVVAGLLRTELGFDGLAVSDGIGMAAVKQRYGLAGAAVRALAAGIDLVCIDNGTTDADMRELTAAIKQALRDGTLAEARLAEAAGRVEAFARWRREAREAIGVGDGTPADKKLAAVSSEEPAKPAERQEPAVAVLATPASRQEPAVAEVATPAPKQEPAVAEVATPAPKQVSAVAGLAVARAAVRVLRAEEGALPLKAAPHVVEAELPRSLADLLPGTTRSPLADTTDIPADRPLVIVVRGIQRSPEHLEQVTRLTKQRPDAVVVDLGVPHTDPGGAAWVAGFGISRVSMQAVAELLAGRRSRN
jgi:beta-N-acetylhexosaminidase